jgi:hypothetical protein
VSGKNKKISDDVSSLSDQLSDLTAQVSELAKANAHKARPYATKLGSAAKDASGDLLHRAEGAVPTLEQVVAAAFSAVAPKVKAARDAAADKASPYVSSAIDHASGAAHDLAPYIGTARDRVKDDLIPRGREAVVAGIAASAPYREEAARRGTAAVAALKGEVAVKPTDRHWGRKILLATGVAGLVFAAYKYLTGESSTSGWQTPTSAPAPSAANTTTGAHAATPSTEADDTSAPADAKPLGDAEVAEDSVDATLPTDGEKSED